MTEQSNNPSCPYCNATLKKMPKARSKCPRCRDWIYLKKPYLSDIKKLMTKTQADEAQVQWDQHHEDAKFFGDKEGWTKMTVNTADAAVEIGDFLTARNLYLELASKYNTDPKRLGFMRKFYHCELKRYEKDCQDEPSLSDYVRTEKPKYQKERPDCECKGGKYFLIKSALKLKPLPCGAQHCICWYSQVFRDELPKGKGFLRFFGIK